ncbi:MAG: aminotransferase class I/II-fold pyridoxal phosphate-dependent enzyme [Planctomycetaceae bacterium]
MNDLEIQPLSLLLTRFAIRSREFPDRVACSFMREDARSEALTYGQLESRSDAVAATLQEFAAPGDRALLIYPQGLELICAFFGCLKAGLIAVPAYPPRKNRKSERLTGIIEDCSPDILLTEEAVLRDLDSEFVAKIRVIETGSIAGGRSPRHHVEITPGTTAFLQYTSGSTIKPRGVVVTHGAIAWNICQQDAAVNLGSSSIMVSWLPLYHDMGLVGAVLSPLYLGGRTVLLSPQSFLQRPFTWLKTISDERANISVAPNFAFDLCVKAISEEQRHQLDLSSLKLIVNGAEPIKPESIDRFIAKFGPFGLSLEKMFPCFGLAESTLFVTGGPYGKPAKRVRLAPVTSEPTTDSDAKPERWGVSCGVAAEGAQVVAVDPQTLTPRPDGKIGEIWVQSPSNATGYWNNPELSHQTFENRLADGSGPFLNTGDLGFMVDGELYVSGRSKDLIIIRGRNIYPQDVERVIERTLPFVEANTSAAVELVSTGTEQLGVVIEATRELVRTARHAEKDASVNQIFQDHITRLRQEIGNEFEVTLDAVAFVRTGSFPRTSSGKVQRHKCRDLLQNGDETVVYRWQAKENSKVNPSPLASFSGSSAKADTLIEWLRDYAARKINSRVMDERRSVPPYVILDFGNHGLFGLQVSESLGGLGLSTSDALRVMEQLGAIDPTLALMVGIHNGLGLRPIQNFGSPTLQRKLLPTLAAGRQLASFAITEPEAGSNPNAIQATAHRVSGGWRVNAHKQWIGLGSWSGCITVFARSYDAQGLPGGIVALNVPDRTTGLRHGPESLTMGARAIVQNSVHLDEAFVPDAMTLGQPGEGMAVAQDAMMFCRVGLAAVSVGGMKRCAQLMLRYSERRSVATGRLVDNPVTITRLEHLCAAIDATQALTNAIAGWIDAGREVPQEAYIACKKLFWQAADHLMQLLGGRGYVETNIAPQLLRDARLLRIFEGPTETLLMYLGANVLLRGESITRMLAEDLQFPAAASALQAAVQQLSNNFSSSTPGAKQWLQFQVGELATAAMLWAATSSSHRSGAIAESSVVWAEQRFQTLQAAAVAANQTSRKWSADSVTSRIRSYDATIGDIEQELPGADEQLDDYLKKERRNPAGPAGAPSIVNVDTDAIGNSKPTPTAVFASAVKDPTISELIRDSILKWMRDEVDPNANAVDGEAAFTSLGIDSVAAASIVLDLETATGVRLTPDILYGYQTVNQLAEFVGSRVDNLPGRPSSNGSPQKVPPSTDVKTQVASSKPVRPTTLPTRSDESHVLKSAFQEFTDRNRNAARLRQAGRYFYGTPFSDVDGPYVTHDGHKMLMLASFAYSGLVGHPEVNTAAAQAIEHFGAGCHGVRLIAGTTVLHRELEQRLAGWMLADDALLFSSGYSTNVATIPALVGPDDTIFADEYNHASLVDGCKLSGASFQIFPHNEVGGLEAMLQSAPHGRRLVIVDGVYSMEGDIAPLPEIVELCRRYDALLMVDEAHSLGVIGKTGRGVQEHFGLAPDVIDIKMGNTSKALASLGGFIAGKQELVDYLRHNARGYVFSTSLGPPQVAAALKALEILEREPQRVVQLQRNAERLTTGLKNMGFRLANTESAIVPLFCQTEDQALELTARCRAAGLYVVPIVYPAVPMNAPRLRLNVMASHTDEQIDEALATLCNVGRELGLCR